METEVIKHVIADAVMFGRLVVFTYNGKDLKGRPVLRRGETDCFDLDIENGLDHRWDIPYDGVTRLVQTRR